MSPVKLIKNAVMLLAVGMISTATLKGGHSKHTLFGEWPIYGQNYENTQTNEKEKLIDRNNVGSLIEGWNLAINGIGVASQPAYADGKVYFGDSQGNVYAANGDTGAIIWQTNLPNNQFYTTPAITKDIVYLASTSAVGATQTANAVALSRHTGELLWSTPLFQPGQYAGEYPGYVTPVEDLLIVPLSSFIFSPQAQGRVMAFNRFTGQLVWTVVTTSDQFQPNPQFGPGASSFSAGAVDTKRKLYFVGTGQTFSGVVSPLSDSLIAIDYCKGRLEWAYQYETNDVWTPLDPSTSGRPFGTFDLDVSVPPNLFTVKVDGKEIDCVGAASKGGKYKIFARSQPNPRGVQPLAAFQLDPGSSEGTIQGTPVVHDGILYIASVAIPQGPYRVSNDNVYIPVIDPVDPNLLNLYDVASMKTTALSLKKLLKFGYTDGTIPEKAVLWTVYSPGVQGRNPLTYANGVLYQTSQTGFLRALDPRNGNELFYVVIDPQPVPNRPGIITAGATIASGRVYQAYGYDPLGLGGAVIGGIKAYQLP